MHLFFDLQLQSTMMEFSTAAAAATATAPLSAYAVMVSPNLGRASPASKVSTINFMIFLMDRIRRQTESYLIEYGETHRQLSWD